ncbi:DNA primase [Marinitoga hydrogenitolerans DSM 16785]|uniref:DNA primase n=1 Tax=Marinitoga hydrogenitolerans (strain DSM 16785 / JCM 12826 / AT1271) TaxID=1122195 RepID=A0A1M4T4M2_MARH1|nr:DNA primase [Marinitoga hydrogenitolerans]SHE39334.1 DNA primase [Marinitoga hydrogenitolerans DSM 16785]
MIPKEIIDEINSRLNIKDIVGNYLSLKKTGKNYTALCPFHPEDTPSFFIFPSTNTFHCFGCGAHGDPISFIQKYEQLNFIDAVKKAAVLAGIDISQYIQRKELPIELQIFEEYHKKYKEILLNLPQSHPAWKYLINRGINKNYAERFGLGFSNGSLKSSILDDFDLPITLGNKLGIVREDGKEIFQNRIIIPINDDFGRVIAFAGRTIKNETPKYLNSPENKFFQKSKILFLFDKSKNIIKREKYSILVEGYFDAISMHINGFENTVAILGSAFTQYHAKKLIKLSDKIITMFDMDEAGQNATLKSLDYLLSFGFQVAIAQYTTKDPDELIKKEGQNGILRTLENSKKFHEFIPEYFKDKYNLDDEFGIEQYLEKMAEWYLKFQRSKHAAILDTFIKRISLIILKPENNIKKAIDNILKYKKYNKKVIPYASLEEPTISSREKRYNELDKQLIWLWIKHKKYRKRIQEKLSSKDFETYGKEFLDFIENGYDLSEILENGSEELINLIKLTWNFDYDIEPERIFMSLIDSIEKFRKEEEVKKLRKMLNNTNDPKEKKEIMKKIFEILATLKKRGGVF